jgi:hypothetical protein
MKNWHNRVSKNWEDPECNLELVIFLLRDFRTLYKYMSTNAEVKNTWMYYTCIPPSRCVQFLQAIWPEIKIMKWNEVQPRVLIYIFYSVKISSNIIHVSHRAWNGPFNFRNSLIISIPCPILLQVYFNQCKACAFVTWRKFTCKRKVFGAR